MRPHQGPPAMAAQLLESRGTHVAGRLGQVSIAAQPALAAPLNARAGVRLTTHRRYGIKYFYDITNRSDFRANPDYKGVCHVALAQEGHCKPGRRGSATADVLRKARESLGASPA